jgi:4-amino-4-deoxy-L-arabinose transferase-like glycosyltransferase
MPRQTDTPTRQNSWRTLVATTALLLLAFFLRVHMLGNQELRGDEGFSARLVRNGWVHSLERILATGEPSAPLHVGALSVAIALWGDGEFALRYPSLLASLLCVPLALALGRRLFGGEAGLWAGVLIACNPLMVWYAQDARNMYPLMVLFTLLASLLLWRAVDARGRVAARWWALYAVAAALGVYSHYYAALALAAHGLWIVLFRRDRLRPFALAGLGAVALVLPWAALHIPAILAYGPTAGGDQVSLPDLATRVMRALLWGDFLGGPAWPSWVIWCVVLLGGVALAWRRAGREVAGWLALAACVPPALALMVVMRRTLFNEGYALVALPALLVLAGGLLSWRPAGPRVRWVPRLVGALSVAAAAVALLHLYYDPSYSRTTGWRDLRARVAEEASPHDILVAGYPDPTLYYYIRGPLAAAVLPASPDAAPETIAEALDPVAARGGRVWWLPSGWDSRNLVRTYLESGWTLVRDGWAGRQHLLIYAPPGWTQAHLVPVNADFGAIRLAGYYVALRVRPGETVRLVVCWQARAPVEADYTVFTHLLAPDGSLHAGQDNPPAAGSRPTSTWLPGETIWDAYSLPVQHSAALGDYVIQVGLYDPATGTRLPVGTADAVRLTAIRVDADAP